MLAALIRIGIRNRVLVDLLFMVVMVGAVAAWVRMPKEEFPQVAIDRLVVAMPWPGVGARDVEDGLVVPAERALEGVPGLARIESASIAGRAILQVDVTRGRDVDATRSAVVRALDGVALPPGALAPIVEVARLQVPLARVGLLGDPRRAEVAEALADGLRALPGVLDVRVDGAWSRALTVTVEPARAAASGVDVEQVARALRCASVGLPAGAVELAEGRLMVRTPRAVRTAADLARVPVRPGLTVGDVARVEEQWTPPEVTARAGGQPAIELLVLRRDDADVLQSVPAIQAWAERAAASLPEGLSIEVYEDSARMVRHRLGVLASNGLAGAVLVALVLVLFVGPRAALLVLWGLPFAYGGALLALWLAGTTVSVVSTFGFVLVTGILVDDAIVVVENIARHVGLGKSPEDAAVDGTVEVLPAVFSSSLTTALAFAPLLLLGGTVGRVLAIVPTVVILSLAVSLVEAAFVLPAHVVHLGLGARLGEEGGRSGALVAGYRRWLTWLVRPGRRGLAVAAVVGIGLVALAVGTLMPRSLTTPGEPVFAFVDVDLRADADRAATEAALRELERWVMAEGGPLLAYVASRAGEQQPPQGLALRGDRYGQLRVGFPLDPETLAQVPELLTRLEARARDLPGVEGVAITTLTGGPPVGRPIDLFVRGVDEEAVARTSEALAARMARRPTLRDVQRAVDDGPVTVDVTVDAAEAARRGRTAVQVGLGVRARLDGMEAAVVTLDERAVPVRVAGPAPADVEGLRGLTLAEGARVGGLAEVGAEAGSARLLRVDGQRAVRIVAGLAPGATASEEQVVIDAAFAAVSKPGVGLVYAGELADASESFGELPTLALVGIVLIYVTLAVQFRSYLQPLLVLASVPCGAAGAVLGLAAFGMELSLIAAIGIVGLVGIVVNSAIVLVDFVNLLRVEGLPVQEAVIDGASLRLRPILSTSVTTVLGLLPLGLGLGGSDALVAPMAVAVSVGLLVATALTLVLLPVLYLLLEDGRASTERSH